MARKAFIWFGILFLLADGFYSFVQFYETPIDGDLSGGVVPAQDVRPILRDPFGVSTWSEGARYPNPNRFFSHAVLYTWFHSVPFVFQTFTSPIHSLYFSAALFKWLVQLGLILVMGSFIRDRNSKRSGFPGLIFAALLIVPLFQSEGYRTYMGIIDPAITYVFFYAFPILLLLIWFRLILSLINSAEPPGSPRFLLIILLACISALSGPLNPGVMLIILFIYAIQRIRKKDFRFTGREWLLTACAFLALYSLFVGQFNSVSQAKSLIEIYAGLPTGLFNILTRKPGFLFLFAAILLNFVILRKHHSAFRDSKYIALFILLYILLLPLGGYRDYRPYTIRYDSFIPVTVCLMYLYTAGTFRVWNSLSARTRKFYVACPLAMLLIFSMADLHSGNGYRCERDALIKIRESRDRVVVLENNCPVLSWEIVSDRRWNNLNSKMLQQLGITVEKKEFYHQTDKHGTYQNLSRE